MAKLTLKQRFYLFLAGTLFPALICLCGLTWRVKFVGRENEEAVGYPLIWAFWHSRLLPLVYFYRGLDIVVLVSQSFDGEVISRAIHRLGFRTIRGSTTRGGVESLIEAVKELRNGSRLAFTPDGPKGPKEIAQIGAAAASVKSKTPIIAVATASKRYWALSSWDKFRIPRPFAKVEIHLSEPIDPSGKTPEQVNDELQAALEKITHRADESVAR